MILNYTIKTKNITCFYIGQAPLAPLTLAGSQRKITFHKVGSIWGLVGQIDPHIFKHGT